MFGEDIRFAPQYHESFDARLYRWLDQNPVEKFSKPEIWSQEFTKYAIDQHTQIFGTALLRMESSLSSIEHSASNITSKMSEFDRSLRYRDDQGLRTLDNKIEELTKIAKKTMKKPLALKKSAKGKN